ncbi:MAG: MCE family protein [Verrucomicrobia bacterium]|nr:MCE family protein [Verrucomicrobiota bacterium]|tara:strand:- start:853 stop:1863 length:1011 start_codon:yes stop_codon:yes gene_type:complete
MSKKARSTMIGLFTLLGLFIAGMALVMLGAGKFFEKTHKVQLYFDKSVYGLQVGSDVRFGGVKIGRVDSISVIIDTMENRKIIPVVVELTEKDLRSVAGGGGEGMLDFSSKEGVSLAVNEGLRAGMKQQSLVTGQLYIEFDIDPNSKGFTYASARESEYPVVPTIPTEIDELISGITDGLKRINELDIAGLMTEIRDVLKNANKQIAELDLKEINENLTGITRDVRNFTSDEKLQTSLANLDTALIEIRELSAKANQNMDPLLEDIRVLAEDTKASLKKIEATADELSKVSDPRSPMLLNFQNLLHETETASRALRELTNDLKRNPNSLLRGKDSE